MGLVIIAVAVSLLLATWARAWYVASHSSIESQLDKIGAFLVGSVWTTILASVFVLGLRLQGGL